MAASPSPAPAPAPKVSSATLLPLCPSCFARVMAWTAASCPACRQSSSVAECDSCQKSRAGGFLPEDAKSGDGGAQRFVCIDCMEAELLKDENDSLTNSLLAVVLCIVAVRWYGRFTWLPPVTMALFVVALASFWFWYLAASRRRSPAKQRDAAWKVFRRRVTKALAARPGAHQR